MVNTKRKRDDSDDAKGGASAGTGVPTPTEPALSGEEARALVDVARIGGGRIFVARPASLTTILVVRLRDAALLETQEQLDGNVRVRLSHSGVQRLVEAQRSVAATPGARR